MAPVKVKRNGGGPRGTKRKSIGAGKEGLSNKKLRSNRKRITSRSSDGSSSYVRTKKRNRVTPEQRLSTSGVILHSQNSNSLIGQTGVVIGHCSAPKRKLLQAAWYAILKKFLYTKMDVEFVSLSEDLSSTLKIGSQFEVTYYSQPTSPTTSTFQTTIVAGSSVESIGDDLMSLQNATLPEARMTLLSYKPYYEGFTIGTFPKLPPATMRLDNGKVKFMLSSSLKWQNRTVTLVADDTADAVNHVLLSGRSFNGKGTGTEFINAPAQVDDMFPVGDANTGLIANSIYVGEEWKDIPKPFQFKRVQKYDSIKQRPGEYKTSLLKDSLNIDINRLHTDYYSGTTLFKHGHYRFCYLEKYINEQNNEDNIIRLVFELSTTLICGFTAGKAKMQRTLVKYD